MLARVERMTPRRCFMLSLTLPPLGMWPAVVSGQPLVRPHRISILSGGTAQGTANWDAFYASMRAIGYEEGRDVVYDRRSADGDTGRLPQLARELLVDNPRLIVTTGGREALAAREATSRIPIVMIFGGVDPVGMGLAQSLARPGGNVTGMTLSVPGITEKRLALLCEAIPTARRIGVLENPGALGHRLYRQELEASAAKLGITEVVIRRSLVRAQVEEPGNSVGEQALRSSI